MSLKQLNEKDIEQLHEIGASLAAETDLDKLLASILKKCRQILSADAASLFLTEGSDTEQPTQLRFKLAQNASVDIQLEEFTIGIDTESLVGVVAETHEHLRIDDVYQMPKELPFHFNPEFDEATGYRSKSLLSVPLVDHEKQLLGVIQIWNRKKSRKAKITKENVDSEVIPFSEGCYRILLSIASQASIALENAKLYENIQKLFEGFIRASVTAIEARDPTTSGHSERVAILTVDLAKLVDQISEGRFSEDKFSTEVLREIHYAALLHDFGKIGVREDVLVKAKKLYPLELTNVLDRMDLYHREVELRIEQRKIDHLLQGGKKDDVGWRRLEEEKLQELAKISRFREMILQSNEPTILPESVSHALHEISGLQVTRPSGESEPILSMEQADVLSIPKGSLSEEERSAIESHVSHTFEFLKAIPWTRDLKRIPEIAYAHHEKLNGSGYPLGIEKKLIPLESRIMTVADIFDALTARDRPYKRALPATRALEILEMEVSSKKLDGDLVQIFIESKIYEKVLSEKR